MRLEFSYAWYSKPFSFKFYSMCWQRIHALKWTLNFALVLRTYSWFFSIIFSINFKIRSVNFGFPPFFLNTRHLFCCITIMFGFSFCKSNSQTYPCFTHISWTNNFSKRLNFFSKLLKFKNSRRGEIIRKLSSNLIINYDNRIYLLKQPVNSFFLFCCKKEYVRETSCI